MPQVGFEAFTPSHNYQVLTDEAARNMGAVYADVYARKKENEFRNNQLKNSIIPVNQIYDNVHESRGNDTALAMTKGHNSPIKFMGGLVGAASGLMGGSSGMGTLAGGIGALFGGGGANVAGNTMHMAMHAKLNRKLKALGSSNNEVGQTDDNPIESVVDQANIAPTGNVIQQDAPNQNLMPFNEDTITNI